MAQELVIESTGMVTCAGLNAAATCAAIRAAVANFTEAKFMDRRGERIVAAQVPDEEGTFSTSRLARFLALAIEDCLRDVERASWSRLPLLLCVAERERPGRPDDLERQLLEELQKQLALSFRPKPIVVPQGRVSAAVALLRARKLLYEKGVPRVLIAGADSYLVASTLRAFENENRLLSSANSNGFIPGEGAAAILLGRSPGPSKEPWFRIRGVGFGLEPATIHGDDPLLANGLTAAIKGAVADAAMDWSQISYRISDLAGEHYHFKEASLAALRAVREAKASFDLWHPADCVGATGAVAGLICYAVANDAAGKRYAPGPGALLHFSADGQARAGVVGLYH